jgi:hypothetical protein
MANKPATEKKKKVTILVTEETLETLEATALTENRSVSNLAGTILKDWSKNEQPTIKARKEDATK